MGPQGVFDVFAAIAKTVHVLHERHWLLRDLRASYILLTRDKYKVTDAPDLYWLLNIKAIHVIVWPSEQSICNENAGVSSPDKIQHLKFKINLWLCMGY